jgi:hypothetical protein
LIAFFRYFIPWYLLVILIKFIVLNIYYIGLHNKYYLKYYVGTYGMENVATPVRFTAGRRHFSPNCPGRPWVPPNLLFNGHRGLFLLKYIG